MPTALKPFFSAALAGVALLSMSGAHAQTTIAADPANAGVVGSGGVGLYVGTSGQSPYYVGSVFQTGQDDAIVFPFQLPSNVLITNATFTAMITGNSSFSTPGTPTFNVDLSGLSRTSASPTVLASDYQGTTVFTDAGLFTPADGFGTSSYSGADLLTFLNAQEVVAPGSFVFFRLKSSASAESASASFNAYQIEAQTAAGNGSAPTLTLTTEAIVPAPEPSAWVAFAVGLLGLGVLTLSARKRRPLMG